MSYFLFGLSAAAAALSIGLMANGDLLNGFTFAMVAVTFFFNGKTAQITR